LIFNAKHESVSYLSKVPLGLIPFANEEEVLTQQHKEKLYRNDVFDEHDENRLTLREILDKNGIEFKLQKKDKKIDWIFYFGTPELMREWLGHLSFMFMRSQAEVNAYYHSQHRH
jgi:hypothetical protein